MGSQFKVAGKYVFNIESWSVSEDATPLAAGDTNGSTGELRVTIPAPDPYVRRSQDTGYQWVLDYGRDILLGKTFTFTDSAWGLIDGTIISVNSSQFGMFEVQCETSLNKLNIYNVQAQPFVGTLGGLLRYYCSLASTPVPVIDSALETRAITAIGWNGELWYHLKMLAVAEEFEVSLVNGVPTFRLLRQRYLAKGREIDRSGSLNIPSLAQTVEVYQYNTVSITNQLVYPPGGWNDKVEILNVDAGATQEYTLDLSSSVTSVTQPVVSANIGPEYAASSVYTVVGSDGIVVQPAMWTANGGSLTVEINPDTTSLTVTIRGATNVPTVQGTTSTNFQIALASDASGSRYSTLRILGTGVAFDKQKRTFRTGVTPDKTGTVIGETTDNPFLSDTDQCYRAGVRSAVRWAGPVPGLSGSASKVLSGTNFGNVAGARIQSRDLARPFRVRSSSLTPGSVDYDADDDLLHNDVEGFREGMTYAQVQATRDGLTYRDDYLAGLR